MPKDDIDGLFDKAEEHLKAIRREEKTITDGMLSPSEDSAPMPPKAKVPRPAPKAQAEPEPELGSNPESAPVFDAREAPTKQQPGRGRRRREAIIESSYPSYAPHTELADISPSVIERSAKVPFLRMLMLIAAASAGVTGIVAATGAAVVNIIAALRPASNADIAKRLDGIETRVNGDFGLGLEVQTRQAKDDELKKAIEEVQKAQKELKERFVVKGTPVRGSN